MCYIISINIAVLLMNDNKEKTARYFCVVSIPRIVFLKNSHLQRVIGTVLKIT